VPERLEREARVGKRAVRDLILREPRAGRGLPQRERFDLLARDQ
jgi:hypothetical protein